MVSRVYYSFDGSAYKHYLFGDGTILCADFSGENCEEQPYRWLPIMQYMSPVNVVSLLYCTDGVQSSLEIACNKDGVFSKYAADSADIAQYMKIGSMDNCIASIKRRHSGSVFQMIFVFNTLETALFEKMRTFCGR